MNPQGNNSPDPRRTGRRIATNCTTPRGRTCPHHMQAHRQRFRIPVGTSVQLLHTVRRPPWKGRRTQRDTAPHSRLPSPPGSNALAAPSTAPHTTRSCTSRHPPQCRKRPACTGVLGRCRGARGTERAGDAGRRGRSDRALREACVLQAELGGHQIKSILLKCIFSWHGSTHNKTGAI